jgi:hypothetical protein
MKNLNTAAKMKLTKIVITRFTKPQATNGFMSSSELTVPTTVSTMIGAF